MKQVLSHLKLIYELKDRNMELFLAHQYPERLPEIFDKADAIELDIRQYKNCQHIQQVLLDIPNSTTTLKQLQDAEIHPSKIEMLLREIPSNVQITHYPATHLIEVLKDSTFNIKSCYLYLEYFSGLNLTEEQRKIVAENLNSLLQTCYRDGLCLDGFTEPELRLFYEPVFGSIPLAELKQSASLLATDPAFKRVMQKFLDYGVGGIDYETLCHIQAYSQRAEQYLEKILAILEDDEAAQRDFLERWIENGAAEYDLQILEKKLPELNNYEELFTNRASYINLVFGQRFQGIPLSELSGAKESLIIYAITNHKRAFLKLAEENFISILEMSSYSILFDPDFRKLLNINSLSQKDLLECDHLSVKKWNADALQGYTYSFQEIKQLFGLPDNYVRLYHKLSVPRLDDKLLILKQLAKRNLLNNIAEADIEILAEKLSVKNAYAWMQEEFNHIKGLTPANAVKLLCAYDALKKLLPTIENETEVLYVLRNKETVQAYLHMEDVKRDIFQLDQAWSELKEMMKIEEAFVIAHQQNITDFLLRNGAGIALTYYKQLSEKKQEAYRRIVIAELMGEFRRLKYFKDDLTKEIGYPISDIQQKAWEKTISMDKNLFTVNEQDGFLETMQLGEIPQHTCMSYINGAYNHCLLSNFDSNKHVVYVYYGGKPVARALLRLTKGKFYNTENKKQPELQFADLENTSDTDEETALQSVEYLTLFLERPYIAGISGELIAKVYEVLIRLAEEKAAKLESQLVLSYFYHSAATGYFLTDYFLYISRSKAGEQYFDSLDGEASISEGGTYKSNLFLVQQKV